jgi:hypothetical protein
MLSRSEEEDEGLMHVAKDYVQWRTLNLRRWNFILPKLSLGVSYIQTSATSGHLDILEKYIYRIQCQTYSPGIGSSPFVSMFYNVYSTLLYENKFNYNLLLFINNMAQWALI